MGIVDEHFLRQINAIPPLPFRRDEWQTKGGPAADLRRMGCRFSEGSKRQHCYLVSMPKIDFVTICFQLSPKLYCDCLGPNATSEAV